MAYSYLNFGAAKKELAKRLNDPNFVFWGNAECGLYLAWAMRLFNSLTAFWVSEYEMTLASPFTLTISDQSEHNWALSVSDDGSYIYANLLLSSGAQPYIQLNDTVTGATVQLSIVSSGVYPALTANFVTTIVATSSNPTLFLLAAPDGQIYSVSITNGLIVTSPNPYIPGYWIPANGAGSPRQPVLSDIDIYTMMEYFLLEPPSGGTWTGTNQFSIAALSQAVQGRRDESLQVGATNMVEIALNVTPGTSRVTLPDNVLDVRRVRYVPVLGSPVTLSRGDAESFRVFTPNYIQAIQSPLRWDVISGPPLALTLDANVPVPCTLQILTMQAEAVPGPPSSTPLGLPDDWAWVPLFGAMADVLSAQEESKDGQRADYCRKRYIDGLALLKNAPWLLEARITDVAVSTPGVVSSDRFSYEWQSNPSTLPEIVVGGTDLYAVKPVPTALTSVLLVLVANAPIPATDTGEIQVPRDVIDAILDEAEHLACIKRGGADFAESIALHQSFLATTQRWNARINQSGIFATTLRAQMQRNEKQLPRFSVTAKGE